MEPVAKQQFILQGFRPRSEDVRKFYTSGGACQDGIPQKMNNPQDAKNDKEHSKNEYRGICPAKGVYDASALMREFGRLDIRKFKKKMEEKGIPFDDWGCGLWLIPMSLFEQTIAENAKRRLREFTDRRGETAVAQ